MVKTICMAGWVMVRFMGVVEMVTQDPYQDPCRLNKVDHVLWVPCGKSELLQPKSSSPTIQAYSQNGGPKKATAEKSGTETHMVSLYMKPGTGPQNVVLGSSCARDELRLKP